MSLADRLEAGSQHQTPTPRKKAHPTGREFEWDGDEGWIQTEPLGERPKDWDAFLIDAGLDPESVEVIEPVQVRGWDTNMGGGIVERMHYYRITVRRRGKADDQDFASLMQLARKARRKPKPDLDSPRRAVVVAYADGQTGKVASRGGTKELLERVQDTLGLLEDYIREVGADIAYLLDPGDAIEGFENVAAQANTNDLSLPRQVEVASDILFEFADLLAKHHDSLVVAGVGSNHCRWRKGKEPLGLPGDDWGIHMLRQLRKALALNEAYSHVSVVWPDEHDETLALDVLGTVVGLAHGHQASKPEGIPGWWAGQVHGGQNIAQASILVTGHFHSFRTQATGRDPFTKREKRWFQAPTLDNGSDWYRSISGEDSDPGLLVFTIDADTGWDNLRILRPGA